MQHITPESDPARIAMFQRRDAVMAGSSNIRLLRAYYESFPDDASQNPEPVHMNQNPLYQVASTEQSTPQPLTTTDASDPRTIIAEQAIPMNIANEMIRRAA